MDDSLSKLSASAVDGPNDAAAGVGLACHVAFLIQQPLTFKVASKRLKAQFNKFIIIPNVHHSLRLISTGDGRQAGQMSELKRDAPVTEQRKSGSTRQLKPLITN